MPLPKYAWDFNSGTKDYVNGLVPSTVGGTPTYVSGKYNQSINFPNSVNTGTATTIHYLTFTTTLNYTTGVSFFFWVNFNFGGVFAQVILEGFGSNIFLDQVNRLRSYDGNGTLSFPSTDIQTGTWYHIGLVIANGTRTAYLNGVSTTGSTVTSGTKSSFLIGGSGNFSSWCSYDDFRIYDQALTSTQALAIYNEQGVPGMGMMGNQGSYILPNVPGYTYVPFKALPSTFTLTQTSTSNAWTYASGSISDGGVNPTLVLTADVPSDMYSAQNPGIWYRLGRKGGTNEYVRHSGLNMFLQSYTANFDFAWAFFIQNGTTNQVKVWNPYPGNGVGNWVQSGIYSSGRISINTADPAQAHVYTLTGTNAIATYTYGNSIFSQLKPTTTSSAMTIFSLRAVNGISTQAVQVQAHPLVQWPVIPMTSNNFTATGTYNGILNGVYQASDLSYTSIAYNAFDNNINTYFEQFYTGTDYYNYNTGILVDTTKTTTVSGETAAGWWLQIRLPTSIILRNYTLAGRISGDLWKYRTPSTFWIAGSNDGTTWSNVHFQSGLSCPINGINISIPQTSNSLSYSYFRMVVNVVGNPGQVNLGNHSIINISLWKLYGEAPSYTSGTATDFWADQRGNLLTAPVIGQTLQNWLGDAIGYVTKWYDQSGLGNHGTPAAVTNQPVIQKATKGPGYMCVYTGGQSVVFGTSPFLNGTSYTMVGVVRRTDGKNNNYYLCSNGGTSAQDQLLHTGYRYINDLAMAHYADDMDISIPTFTTSATEPINYNFLTLGSDKVGRMYSYSGGTRYSTTRTFVGFLSQPTGSYSLGQGFGTGFVGEIYEILIFTKSLYDLDMTAGLITQIYNDQVGYTGL